MVGCNTLSAERIIAAGAWLQLHNDARENVYLRQPRAVQQDRDTAVIHQNFPPTHMYDKDGF